MCSESFCDIRGFGVDTPRPTSGRKDERERDEKRKKPEGNAIDRVPEPPSQSCTPPMRDVSQWGWGRRWKYGGRAGRR